MAYCGYIVTLHDLRKHSNADRLQCATVFEQNVIVDLNYYDGQKVVFFPSDGQLSEEYANDNNLVRRKDENGNNVGGYMDAEKRNITAIKLRGEKSEGLVLPIETLGKYTDITKLKDGDKIDVLNGIEICKKYIPKSNHRTSSNSNKSKGKKSKKNTPNVNYEFFEEHIDTQQLAYNMDAFKPGDTVYITRKIHGTSARTMLTKKITEKATLFTKLFHRKPKKIITNELITGSRRVTLNAFNDLGYYGTNEFRKKYHDLLKSKDIPMGFEVFYEIVGYVNESTPIMGSCDNKKVKDKEFVKKFGDTTVFSYGCEPGENSMYIYRITCTTPDGTVVELPWENVKYWANLWGIPTVPELEKFIFSTKEDLKERINKYNNGMPCDEIGKTHIAEGVVVRIDNRNKFTAFKDKTFEFKVLEGIIKDSSDVPDMEEAQEEIIEENV